MSWQCWNRKSRPLLTWIGRWERSDIDELGRVPNAKPFITDKYWKLYAEGVFRPRMLSAVNFIGFVEKIDAAAQKKKKKKPNRLDTGPWLVPNTGCQNVRDAPVPLHHQNNAYELCT